MSGRFIGTVDVRLKSPFTAVVAGPTGSGKTETLFNMIRYRNKVCTEPPAEVLYCYGAWQSKFEQLADDVTFIEGSLNVERDVPDDGKPRWMILDDLMEESSGKNSTNNLYTKHSHHRNISVFFVVQNLFKKENRTLSLNTHYLFLFKNPRDKQIVDSLARQAFPGKVAAVREAYNLATKEAYSFLLIDMKQTTDDRARLIGNFAHPTEPMKVYDVYGTN